MSPSPPPPQLDSPLTQLESSPPVNYSIAPTQQQDNGSQLHLPNLTETDSPIITSKKSRRLHVSNSTPKLHLKSLQGEHIATGSSMQRTFSNSKGFSPSQTSRYLGTNSTMLGQEIQSVSTLRFSSSKISFSKSDRFGPSKQSYQDIVQYDLPSLLNTQSGTGFGFGEKRIMPQHVIRNAQTNPSPQKYATHSNAGSSAVSRSFGIPFKFYTKTYLPNVTIKEPEAAMEIPGVGSYEIQTKTGQNKVKYSLSAKGKPFQELYPTCSPPCNQYSPMTRIVSPSRFSETSFGFGKKFDFTAAAGKKASPGPGAYILPSAFDKFKKPRPQRTAVMID